MVNHDQIHNALNCIPSNLERTQWITIARALYSELGESGFSMFDEWNQGWSGYNAKDSKSAWRSVRNTTSTNISTLFYHAKQYGFDTKTSRVEYTSEQKAEYAKKQSKLEAEREANEKRETEKRKQWFDNVSDDYEAATGTALDSQYIVTKLGEYAANICSLKYSHKKQSLIYPLKNINNEVTAYQVIRDNGRKKIYGNKKGSFALLGELTKNTQKAYIAEGLATGLTVHAALNCLVIVAIDSGNLPVVTKAIQTKYKSLQLICAADNDCYTSSHAGVEAAKKSGIAYSLPNFSEFSSSIDLILEDKSKPTDFNDLLKYADIETVKRQLTKVIGITNNVICEKFLSIEPAELGLTAIRSRKGSGKTRLLKKLCSGEIKSDEKTLIISHRVILNAQLAEDLGAELCNDLDLGNHNYTHIKNSRRLVITPHSIGKISGTRWRRVIIDEFEQVLAEVASNSLFKGKRRATTDLLQAILRHSEQQVVLDADLGSIGLDFCSRAKLSGSYINNTYQREDRPTIHLVKTREELESLFIQQTKKGQFINFCSNSKKQIDKLATQLPKRGGEYLTLTGDTEAAEKFEFVKSLQIGNYGDLQTLLTSPAACTGLDISNHNFDSTFACFSQWVNSGITTTAEDCLQHISRVRNMDNFYIHINPIKHSKPETTGKIRQHVFNSSLTDYAEFLSIDVESLRTKVTSPELEELYCDVVAKRNKSINNLKGRFIELAELEGYKITEHAEDLEAKAKQKSINEEIEASRIDALYADIQSAGLVHFDSLDNHDGKRSIAETKTYIATTFELPLGDELDRLTLAEIESGYTSRLKPLILTYSGANKLKQDDMFEVSNGTEAPDLSHYSTQAKIYIKILSYAGITKELELDCGTTWRNETLNTLKRYLKNNKVKLEGLNIASGKEIEKGILKPARFLNGQLKRIEKDLVDSNSIRIGRRVHKHYSVNEEKFSHVANHAKKLSNK